jgi:hypothetical protein
VSEDDRDFLERADSISTNLYGKPASPESMAENFALYGLKKRAEALDKFDSELREEIDSSPHSLRRRVALMDLRRRMDNVHQALRKAGR